MTTQCFAENASDMQISSPDERNWWEPGRQQFYVDFSRAKIAKIVARGNRMVPKIVQEACARADISTDEIDHTHYKPAKSVFLRNWREALQVDAEACEHVPEYGNLFGAGIPVSLEQPRRLES